MAAIAESATTWADAEDDAAPPTEELAKASIDEAPKEPEKPKIALAAKKDEEPITEETCDAAWTSAELAGKCCDVLVASGKLRTTPAFIRTDREAKLAKIFETAKLDGAKVLACTSARELEVIIRNATQGEGWVDDVQKATKTFLPAAVQRAKAKNVESDQAKKAKEAYRVRAAEGKIPSARDRGDQPGDDAFASFAGGGGGGRTCYNCGQAGHISRDCPNGPGAGGGQNRDDAFASFGGGGDRTCYNCGQPGHISRDCPNPPTGGGRDEAFANFGGGGRQRDDAAFASFNGGGDRACYNCGQPGHISRDCPNPPSGDGRGRDDAFSSFGGGGGGGDRECYNCGQVGHISRDCPEPPKGRY